MNSDQQVLKGLTLLLKDMNFNVISASSHHQLEDTNITQTDRPDLFVFPLNYENGKSGINLVKSLRVSFDSQIPGVLIKSENGSNDKQTIGANTMVLSDQVKPGVLRKKIYEILDSCLEENCDG